MKAEQIAIIRKTFAKIKPVSDKVAELFYHRLFELKPSLKSLFKKDLKVQGMMLMQMIDFAVKNLDNSEELLPTLQELGKRHVNYEVKEEYYDTVGEALLWTLEQTLGSDFTREAKEAWGDAYKLLSSIMINAAKEVE
ncbi:MAG: globin family protein [Candidatus Loosdrechtia sp.]|uniref:globin family protein n=1 Tax=Candidatus Loosdrechtia sp. TaxID=3101272 RepID=UPI003A6EE755|nr:MAG: globin family protein [Candidatus Jettenia sp. AMX2]